MAQNWLRGSQIAVKKDSVLKSSFLKPATEKEVKAVINEMKTNKSSGPNSIPMQILKISNQIIYKPVTYLINLFLLELILINLSLNRIFPDYLKLQMLFLYSKEGKPRLQLFLTNITHF